MSPGHPAIQANQAHRANRACQALRARRVPSEIRACGENEENLVSATPFPLFPNTELEALRCSRHPSNRFLSKFQIDTTLTVIANVIRINHTGNRRLIEGHQRGANVGACPVMWPARKRRHSDHNFNHLAEHNLVQIGPYREVFTLEGVLGERFAEKSAMSLSPSRW